MKANDGTGNNAARDEWETPLMLIQALHAQYKFDVDLCSTKLNKKAQFYCSDIEQIERKDIVGYVAWMNPPFSKAHQMFTHFFKIITRGVAIYRCDNMESKLWQDIILKNASWIFIPNKRVNYERLNGDGARFPSAIIGFNVDPPIHLHGKVLFPFSIQRTYYQARGAQ